MHNNLNVLLINFKMYLFFIRKKSFNFKNKFNYCCLYIFKVLVEFNCLIRYSSFNEIIKPNPSRYVSYPILILSLPNWIVPFQNRLVFDRTLSYFTYLTVLFRTWQYFSVLDSTLPFLTVFYRSWPYSTELDRILPFSFVLNLNLPYKNVL